MESLRYWALEMHVDGFRFDLCSALGRENGEYGQGSAFFDAIGQDPVMAGLKLIAEPWDLGPFGYQLGNFPPGWAEWNGQYRDTVRRFWKGDEGLVANLASQPGYPSDFVAAYTSNIASKEDNVKAVVTKVSLGEADAGIVYTTDVRAGGAKVAGVTIPEDLNLTASYPIVQLKAAPNPKAAEAFIGYVTGSEGQKTLASYGFLSSS